MECLDYLEEGASFYWVQDKEEFGCFKAEFGWFPVSIDRFEL